MYKFILPNDVNLAAKNVSAVYLLLTEPYWAIPLFRNEGGQWDCDLPLKPGRYRYRIVLFPEDCEGGIDGIKVPKPILSLVEQTLIIVKPGRRVIHSNCSCDCTRCKACRRLATTSVDTASSYEAKSDHAHKT